VIIVDVLDTTGFQQGPIVIYKFDSIGAILWRHYIKRQTQLNGIMESRSGAIVACGWGGGYPISIAGDDTTLRLGGDLIKFDQEGNLIFYQVYEYDVTQSDVLYDITETADGGYASVGDAYDIIGSTAYQRAWLLKVDNNGCLNGDCPTLYTGIKTIPDMVNFFVFPNPISSRYTVALAGPQDINLYHDLVFSLYDLSGRLVYQQVITQQTTLMQRGDLSNGLYIWNISDGDQTLLAGR
jgi:hypothetical protein